MMYLTGTGKRLTRMAGGWKFSIRRGTLPIDKRELPKVPVTSAGVSTTAFKMLEIQRTQRASMLNLYNQCLFYQITERHAFAELLSKFAQSSAARVMSTGFLSIISRIKDTDIWLVPNDKGFPKTMQVQKEKKVEKLVAQKKKPMFMCLFVVLFLCRELRERQCYCSCCSCRPTCQRMWVWMRYGNNKRWWSCL